MTDPLLFAENARIGSSRDVLVASMSVRLDGECLGLVGDWTPLFRLFSRVATLTEGTVRVLGEDAATVVASNRLGLALLGAVFPPTWSTNDYLATSARLLGLGGRDAKRAATAALDALGLGALRRRSLGDLDPVERRAFGVAQAIMGDPPVLLLDRPFDGLSDPGKIWIDDVVSRATRGRRLILGARAPAATGVEARLLERMDQVAVMNGGEVIASGTPRDVLTSRRCVVRASRALDAFERALVDRGLRVERVSATGDGADDGRLFVDLPEGTTASAIVDAALIAQAPLLELVPIGLEIRK